MIRFIRYAIVVVMTLAVLLLLWQFAGAIVLFILSLAVAAVLSPFVDGLASKGVSKRWALGIVYTLAIVSLLSLVLLGGPLVSQDVQIATNDLVDNYDRVGPEWTTTGSLFQRALAERLPPSQDLLQALTNIEDGMPILTGAFSAAQNVFSSIANFAMVIVLSLYWSADQVRFERLGSSLVSDKYHPKVLQVWRSVGTRVGAYLRGELVQSILTGLIVWLGYQAMEIKYPTVLALWVAVVRLIPWFGALIAVIPALLIGVGTSSLLSILAACYTIVVLLFVKLVIEPRFFRRQRYSALLIVLFVIALAGAFGFMGVVLAPPLAVAVQIFFEQLYPFPEKRFSPQALQTASDIRKRLREVRRRLSYSSQRANARLMNRIQHLMKRTIDHLEEY